MTIRSLELAASSLLVLGAFAHLPPAPLAGQTAAALEQETQAARREQPSVETLDTSQAYLMLELLTGIAQGAPDPAKLDAIMRSEGTELIVGQFNLARRASAAQYRQLLLGLMEGVRPEIEPVDSTRQAEMGVVGLLEGCWPRLIWGLGRTELLRERVDHLRDLDFYEQAQATANRFLPEPLQVSPRVFAVIGGRTGGAKIGVDRLYLDVLAYSYRDRADESFASDAELIGTIAHEMHHMGYAHYLSRMEGSLSLSESERMMFGFASSILSEGSATYLISADRDLGQLLGRRSYAQYLERDRELLATSEGILRDLMDGEIRTEEEYEAATADLLGNWFHSTGSLMLSIIDEAGGLGRVMEVVADPRMLLAEYNRAAELRAAKLQAAGRDGVETHPYLFDARIAGGLLRVGS